MRSENRIRRIGIYAGSFDPVHAGHIAFALQAVEIAKLDEVIFLPERQPRFKRGVEHFGHRCAMLSRAITPHPKLSLIELTDRHFTIKRTLVQLRKMLPGAELVLLTGSDVLPYMKSWPDIDRLLETTELVVGARGDESVDWIRQQINMLPTQPKASHVLASHAPRVSSGRIREALRARTSAEGCLPSVNKYANQNWLYVSVISL